MMDEHYQNLFKVLEKEFEMYGNILRLCQSEQKDIVEGNLEAIDRNTQEKEKILRGIASLEKYRRAFLSKIAQHFKIHPKQLTLSKLVRLISPQYKDAYVNMENQLQGRLAIVKEVNEVNAELLKTSLDCVEFTLNLFSNKSVGTTYDNAARQPLQGGSESFFLDKQV